jgi:uncharacterized alkaline shock family protein YloU
MKKEPIWLMSAQENKTDFGALRIKNEVLATIASTAATQVEGVARTGSSLLGGIKGIFSRRIYQRGAYIEFSEENELKVTVHVVAKYGANLPDLASSVQNNVRLAVEKMTGIIPFEVNVIIQGVEPLKK